MRLLAALRTPARKLRVSCSRLLPLACCWTAIRTTFDQLLISLGEQTRTGRSSGGIWPDNPESAKSRKKASSTPRTSSLCVQLKMVSIHVPTLGPRKRAGSRRRRTRVGSKVSRGDSLLPVTHCGERRGKGLQWTSISAVGSDTVTLAQAIRSWSEQARASGMNASTRVPPWARREIPNFPPSWEMRSRMPTTP